MFEQQALKQVFSSQASSQSRLNWQIATLILIRDNENDKKQTYYTQ
jgi:hypothetical protein